ncbi:MAG: ChaN family lipoprotein [Acidobacteria bacterium]|nr:ChaN family lipoprotein [Acidobacteriota bacterium]
MATASALRSKRRSAGQLHALASLQREIQATDPNARRKYLRDFAEAFLHYEAVVSRSEMQLELLESDVVLVGDYHALPGSQRFAAELLESLARSGRPVALGVETVFARHQNILDEWMHGEISDDELRERIRFDADWGYEWAPFLAVLQSARRNGVGAYGLDCMPRDDLRKIAARDRHAADKIAEIRERYPRAIVLVLFGESHLAPNHLPTALAHRLPGTTIATVLQNVDPLYWRAAGERRERVDAVRVEKGVFCVFNATPLEKYESYRLCIERWRQERASSVDLAPTFYNLVEALARFLHVDSYAPHNGTQPKFLVDMLPEVYYRPTADSMRKLLARKLGSIPEEVLARLESQGCCYVPRVNAIFVREFQMLPGAEEAARFLHRACRGTNKVALSENADDRFYGQIIEQALAYFGSRVLYPARPAVRESDLYVLYAQPREAIEEHTIYTYREYMQMIDFLVMHKDYELHARHYSVVPDLIAEGIGFAGEKCAFVTTKLGQMLGSEMYDAYVSGKISKRYLRSLFFRKLEVPGAAHEMYFQIVRRARRRSG